MMLYTKYESSTPSIFKNSEVDLLCSHVLTVTPAVGPALTPGALYEKT